MLKKGLYDMDRANRGCGRNPLKQLIKWGHDGLH